MGIAFGKNRFFLLVFGLSLLVTISNAIKPLYIDDTYYYYSARHIQQNPLRPLDGESLWLQWPRHMRDDNTTLVLPYWLAPAVKLFGERPLLWKLWLFPFVFAFVSGVYLLLRRFARGFETPLLFMIALSPAFLPSWNLMLDMPALSLIVAALALFMLACDRKAASLAVLAGIVTSLAIETKYIGFILPPVIVLYAIVFGRKRLGLIAVIVAVVAFVGMELAMFHVMGTSLFFKAMTKGFISPNWPKVYMLRAMIMTIGATSIYAGLILLVCTKLHRFLILVMSVLISAAICLVAYKPIEHKVFMVFGLLVFLGVLLAVIRLLELRSNGRWNLFFWKAQPESIFLFFWLVLEIGLYFFISPFAAVRRILGPGLVILLVVGRIVSKTQVSKSKTQIINILVVLQIALGLGFYALDLREAQVAKNAAQNSATWIRQNDPNARIWYAGHWGFAYYADREGMLPVIPDHSQLRTGDWFVLPDRIDKQIISPQSASFQLMHKLTFDDPVKLQTMFCFYSGIVPLQHRAGPRLETFILRADSDFIPQTGWDPIHTDWDISGRLLVPMDYSLVYLNRCLQNPDPLVRRRIIEVLGKLGSDATAIIPQLKQQLEHKDLRVRQAAENALKNISPDQ